MNEKIDALNVRIDSLKTENSTERENRFFKDREYVFKEGQRQLENQNQ